VLASEPTFNIDALIFRLLDSPYTTEWWDVTHTLSRLGRFVVSDLIRVLNDGTPFAAAAAARILGEIGLDALPAVPALLAHLEHADPRVRAAAAHALAQINPRLKGSAPYLVERFAAETSTPARRGLLRVLGGTGRAAAAAVPYVEASLEEDELFEDAVYALQCITRGEQPSADFLIERLRSHRTLIRCVCARALARCSADPDLIRAALTTAADRSDLTLEEEAAAALRKLERRQKRPGMSFSCEDV
jgi:HEAT repeat protein